MTTLRCWRSSSDPSTSCDGTAASAPKSVHEAGTKDREPSGSTKIKSRRPCRRIQPKTCNDFPKNG